MNKFTQELRYAMSGGFFDNAIKEFHKDISKTVKVPFEINIDYINKANYRKTGMLRLIHDGWNYRTEHKLKKEFEASIRCDMSSGKFLTLISDAKTGNLILHRQYSIEEFSKAQNPFFEIFTQPKYYPKDKELIKDIKTQIKKGAFDLTLPIEHQSFLLNRFIADTPQYADMKERDISTTALFKKELNNLAKSQIQNELYTQQFTKMIDIPDSEIDKRIEAFKPVFTMKEVKELCEKLISNNDNTIHEVKLLLSAVEPSLEKVADIKLKLSKRDSENVFKFVHNDKQFSVETQYFEEGFDTAKILNDLKDKITEVAEQNGTFEIKTHSWNTSVEDLESALLYTMKNNNKDLSLDVQVEQTKAILDKKAQEAGLKDYKEVISTLYCMNSVNDTFIDKTLYTLADKHTRTITASDLDGIYENNNDFERACAHFEDLQLLSREKSQALIEDLRDGTLIKQAKAFERKHGDFDEYETAEAFFEEYLPTKGITEKDMRDIPLENFISALSHKSEHNLSLEKTIIKNRVLAF